MHMRHMHMYIIITFIMTNADFLILRFSPFLEGGLLLLTLKS